MAVAASVLIVGDDPEIRQLLVGYLGRNGFQATAVRDGVAMYRAMQRREFDLLVLDLMLRSALNSWWS